MFVDFYERLQISKTICRFGETNVEETNVEILFKIRNPIFKIEINDYFQILRNFPEMFVDC